MHTKSNFEKKIQVKNSKPKETESNDNISLAAKQMRSDGNTGMRNHASATLQYNSVRAMN